MNQPVVEIRSLLVRRGGQNILQVERLNVGRGDVAAVLGPNGAGKSTLLNSLLGFIRPNVGEIRVLGRRVHPPAAPLYLLRRRVGFVPQALAAHGETPLTVREVAAIGRTGIAGLFRRLKSSDWRLVDSWLERLGLGELAERAYAGLSGGEQRKTLIAKAMVQEPELLLLDEPTANLDLFWREQIVEALERLYEQTRLTVLLVCHQLEAIPPCCRRLVVLRGGRPVADGPPEQVLGERMVEELYGSRLRLFASRRRYAAVPAGE
ncbi:MAG: metal ABC transporter ATP-binding protein [Pirellulales bacterium]|nr:metal ABC transporter ATP-binding protein [Pirellulales bacterium]